MEPFTSKEEFNKYVMLYGDGNLPPVYMISEVASFDVVDIKRETEVYRYSKTNVKLRISI